MKTIVVALVKLICLAALLGFSAYFAFYACIDVGASILAKKAGSVYVVESGLVLLVLVLLMSGMLVAFLPASKLMRPPRWLKIWYVYAVLVLFFMSFFLWRVAR